MMMKILTCHTPECGNEGVGIPHDMHFYDENGDVLGEVGGAVCGPCGQPITDIVDEPAPEEVDPHG